MTPLSQTQIGIYIESLRNEGQNIYHTPHLALMHGVDDPERLVKAVQAVVAAFPSISARVKVDDNGTPVLIDASSTGPVEVQLTRTTEEKLMLTRNELIKPFELDGGTLAHINVIATEKHVYLFTDFHHSIFDGHSHKLFLKAVDAAYVGKDLEKENVTIYEVARREKEARSSDALDRCRAEYAEMLGGADTELEIMPDTAGVEEGYATLSVPVGIAGKDYKEFCRRMEMPSSVPAVAAMGLVLSSFCNKEDVVFSTIWHGRKGHEFDRTFGMMVKTIPARVSVGAGESVSSLLRHTARRLKIARDNGLYSFADVVSEFGINSDFLFAYQGDFLDLPQVGGVPVDDIMLESIATGARITVNLSIKQGEMSVEVQYRRDLYSSRLINAFVSSLGEILRGMISGNRDTDVRTLRLVPAEDENEIYTLGRGPEQGGDPQATIPDLFVKAAERYPDNIAVVFRDRRMTYAELDKVTDALAAELKGRYGVRKESIVGVLIERSELMAVLPLAIMKAGGAYIPLDPHFPEERLMFMAQDAGVKLIIGDDGLVAEKMPAFSGAVINASEIRDLPAPDFRPAIDTTPDSSMVVLYTSGSTGKPKGVTLEQHNIVNFCHAYTELTGMSATDIAGAYAAFGFDAHMMDLYPALLSGATVHIFDSEIRLDLTAMHGYMERERITVMFMTTQIAWQMATLFEFSTLRVLSGGGEKLPPLGPLPYVFFNVYGPTECSVLTTAFRLHDTTDGRLIGRPLAGYEVRILDRNLRLLPAGVTGELVIMGAGVGRGYLNRPELTSEKFIEIDGVKAYRTGDQARWTADGDIEFLGRMDGMVKLRGLRIELGEIEAVAASHPDVASFTAAVKEIGGAGNLVGYFTVREGRELTADDLREYMAGELTEFMVPAVIMKLDSMPLTPNGKVDRRALPVPEMAVEEHVEPATDIEIKVTGIVADILGHADFGVTTGLISVGLTSLMVMRLAAAIMKNLGVKLTAKQIMSAPTVREIAVAIESAGTDTTARKESSRPRRRYYPLTENQRGVYIDWEMNRDALQYNIPQAFRFGPGTDTEALRKAVLKVADAHPGLKTRLSIRGGDVVQERRDDDIVDVAVTDLAERPTPEFFQSLVKPFDLLSDALFRCGIFRYGSEVYMFMDTHHIIFDGVSAMVFQQELAKAYAGATLEAEEYTALDYALDQKELVESEEMDKAAQWFDSLIGESEPTRYPQNRKPDSDIAGEMGRLRLRIPSEDIKKFCAAGGVTPSNYLLSSFLQLLHRIVREETVQITTVTNGRSDLRLLNSTGMFVKTLPVVSRCKNPGVSPLEFVRDIQQQFITSTDYDFYPFTSLVERNGVRPEIMYVFEGGINLGGDDAMKAEKIPLRLDTAKVPLTLLVFEPSEGEYELVAEYDTSVYNKADMELLLRMMASLNLSLPEVAAVGHAKMVDDDQEHELSALRNGRRCEVEYESFHGAMEMRADATPDAPALVACDRRMTYREFDEECNRVANALISRGVQRGDRIVILLPRRSYLITAIYGTMKAGAAYIPCDPDYPADRIRLITEDSGARYIVTTSDRLGIDPGRTIDINDLLSGTDTARPAVSIDPEDVAYMIYTSGSTGRPKGVMIPHRAITNYLYGYRKLFFEDNPDIRTQMLIVTISFDASLVNLGTALTSGHCLVLADEEECKDVVLLSKLMLENQVDSFDITPSRLDAMLDLPEFRQAVSIAKHINIGGEGFQSSLVTKLYEAGFRGMTVNEYGPTETTVGSNHAVLQPGGPIVAGRPFMNMSQRIVDAWGSELPVGAVGELYIFGRGVGLGYNKLPEKTAEAYVTFHGERAYRTGDLARWTPDGEVVILGRIDHQVKIRGLRIELGEIENVARTFPGILAAAADVREINKIQHLCLYYTAAAAVDKEALREHLAASLTEYMVPDAYTQIEQMPLTPNGKTNRKALPEPELAPLNPYVEPEGDLEKEIARVFGDILQRELIGANDDFFAIGGTSISAIKVVAALVSAGHAITYKNVFACRTPRAIAAMLEGGDRAVSAVPEPASSSVVGESEFAAILNRNTIDAFRGGERQPIGNVLLTGATGFMGIHMLHELLGNTDSNICCLLRSRQGLSAESRLRTLLFYYFNDTFDDEFASGRLRVVEGDVTAAVPDAIAECGIDTVINCAANVKHFSAGDDIETVNVESVRNLAAFCLGTGARLVHVSTVSIAGESVNGVPDPSILLTEKMFDFGQSLSNQYVHSKYEAERVILENIRDHGLNAKIMRVGNLSARGSDGEFQINSRSNAFMGKLRAYAMLGCAPYSDLDAPCEFSPIDEVCHAIVLLSTTPVDMTVFQPCNNHRFPLGDVLHILSETGIPVEPVEAETFEAAKNEAMTETDTDRISALQPLLAYDSGTAGRTAFIRYDSSFTNQILYRLGFRWNYTSSEYVRQFVKAISSLDYFSI